MSQILSETRPPSCPQPPNICESDTGQSSVPVKKCNYTAHALPSLSPPYDVEKRTQITCPVLSTTGVEQEIRTNSREKAGIVEHEAQKDKEEDDPRHLFPWTRESWQDKTERIVNEPYNYLTLQPGKDIRKHVLAACNVWLQVDSKSLGIIGQSIAMLHNASLLIDDIEDHSQFRRGFPVAHSVYGVPQTINSANYVYFQAQQLLMNLENWPAAVKVFNEELLNLHRGQGMDLYWRDTFAIPTIPEYLQMISNKTGGLFRLAVRLMMAMSDFPIDLVPLAELLGLIFQIQDDYRNLTCAELHTLKTPTEDITEGKFSLPIIHSLLRSSCPNNPLLNILKQHTEDCALKDTAVVYMRDVMRSFEYMWKLQRVLQEQARAVLDGLGTGREELEEVLRRLDIE